MAKTMDEGFSTFLSWLQPLDSEHNKVTSHKESVERCLVNKFACSNLFETGSFGNGTGIRHHSDTDYFAVIPTSKLKQTSSTSLREVKEALIDTFPRTNGIVVNSPAVRIPFGDLASETMEVTPADLVGSVQYDGRNFSSYDIADGEGGWMRSSPTAHNEYVKKIDNSLSKQVKPLIRLVKAWKYYRNVPISSFFLELYVTRYCSSEQSIIYHIDLQRILTKLLADGLPGMNDPIGISGRIKPCESDAKYADALSKLKMAAERAEKASSFIFNDKIDEAFGQYSLLFNYEFPSR